MLSTPEYPGYLRLPPYKRLPRAVPLQPPPLGYLFNPGHELSKTRTDAPPRGYRGTVHPTPKPSLETHVVQIVYHVCTANAIPVILPTPVIGSITRGDQRLSCSMRGSIEPRIEQLSRVPITGIVCVMKAEPRSQSVFVLGVFFSSCPRVFLFLFSECFLSSWPSSPRHIDTLPLRRLAHQAILRAAPATPRGGAHNTPSPRLKDTPARF